MMRNNTPKYIRIDFRFMIEDFNFEIIEEVSSKSYGGNEIVILRSGEIFIKIVKDRGQYGFYFSNSLAKSKDDWYDWDIVKQYLEHKEKYELQSTGERLLSLYDEKLQLKIAQNTLNDIKNKFPDILLCFGIEKFGASQKSLSKFENQRAKLRYG